MVDITMDRLVKTKTELMARKNSESERNDAVSSYGIARRASFVTFIANETSSRKGICLFWLIMRRGIELGKS